MGAVATALTIQNDQMYCSHVGDTRLYCLRDQELILLTEDHTLVMEEIRNGRLDPKDEHTYPYRHIVTQAIISNAEINPFFVQFELKSKDILLLCSDGLHGQLTNDEILEIMNSNQHSTIVENLVEASNAKGGIDNVTVVLIVLNDN